MKNKTFRFISYSLNFLIVFFCLSSCFVQFQQPTVDEKIVVKELLALDTIITVTKEELNDKKSGKTYITPRFPGSEHQELNTKEKLRCSQKELLKYVYGNLNYPEEAKNNGIEGQVVTQFVITKEGYVGNIRLVRDLPGGCGQEALRIIRNMNFLDERWVPGLVDGEPTFTKYTLPVKFKLEG